MEVHNLLLLTVTGDCSCVVSVYGFDDCILLLFEFVVRRPSSRSSYLSNYLFYTGINREVGFCYTLIKCYSFVISVL